MASRLREFGEIAPATLATMPISFSRTQLMRLATGMRIMSDPDTRSLYDQGLIEYLDAIIDGWTGPDDNPRTF